MVCTTCGAEYKTSKAGNLYCPRAFFAEQHKVTPNYFAEANKDFLPED